MSPGRIVALLLALLLLAPPVALPGPGAPLGLVSGEEPLPKWGFYVYLETVLALGGVAHRQVIATVGGRQVDHKFGHGARHALPGVGWELVDSYHPSRYNLNTRRLTADQFTEVLSSLRD